MDRMKDGDDSLGCTTSGRSDNHTSAVGNSAVSTSAAFRQLSSEAGVGQPGSVRQWDSTEQDFSATFKLGELLGTGGFAVVKRGKCPETGEEVAVKIVDRIRYGAQHSQNLEREIALLQRLDHPHLVRLKRVYVSPARVYIVTELLTGGELLDQLTAREKYPEPDARRMMQQLLQAVDYLHQQGIAHRDLKLENLLLATPAPDAPIKIADLGLSKCFLDDPLRTICGSPQYVAPEVLTTGLLRASYSCAADLWSLGVVLFILLAGFSPFDDDNEARMFERIRGGCYSLEGPPWQHVSRPARDLVRRLLCVDPKRRLTAAGALLHPWISSPGATPAGGAGAAASSPEQLKFKVSPRRPTIRGLDQLVLQSRSPNQSSPESPGRSPRSPRDEGAKSTMPGSPNCSPRALRPDAGRSAKSPSSGASSPRSNGEHSGGRVGGWRDGPASPRSPRVSSPLGKVVGPTEIGVSRSKETNKEVTPSKLSVQINKLLR